MMNPFVREIFTLAVQKFSYIEQKN